MADIASAWAAGHLDDGEAVLIVDEHRARQAHQRWNAYAETTP